MNRGDFIKADIHKTGQKWILLSFIAFFCSLEVIFWKKNQQTMELLMSANLFYNIYEVCIPFWLGMVDLAEDYSIIHLIWFLSHVII